MNRLLDINIDWPALLKIMGVTLGSGGVMAMIILWARHRKEDSAKAGKTLAEKGEIEERSKLIKLERDERIFEISTKLVEKLSEECETTKKELDITLSQLHEVRKALETANRRCIEMEESLQREKENNRICTTELEQLQLKLEVYMREDRRRGPI